jgi:hypothetical protein
MIATILLVFSAFCLSKPIPSQEISSTQDQPKSSDILELSQESTLKPDGAHWIIDFQAGSGVKRLPKNHVINVLIMGDGFLETDRDLFFSEAKRWYSKFLAISPYRELRGAFTVTARFRPSQDHVSPLGAGIYGTKCKPHDERYVDIISGVSTQGKDLVAQNLADIGLALQPGAEPQTPAVGVMLENPGPGIIASGFTLGARGIYGSAPFRIAYGENAIHEFCHALAPVRDEYISKPGNTAIASPVNFSVGTLTNLYRTTNPTNPPWSDLRPGTEMNPSRESVIGELWRGGTDEFGVYHSEPFCLMNGTHENWDLNMQRRGANLRDQHRLCYWCEEIVVAQICKLTGLLGDESSNSSDSWQAWTKIRPNYWKLLRVKDRIEETNRRYEALGVATSPLLTRVP